ncbi:hypothetical protein ACHWQZ_G009273 [Mnemiopsis leidyi]
MSDDVREIPCNSTSNNEKSPSAVNLSKVLRRARSTLSLPNKSGHEIVTIVDSDEDSLEVITSSSSSDKDSCSICLGAFTNRAFLNDCFHAFCYYCILQWSEISQTCPLCKKPFSVLIHDVKSIKDYKETHVKKDEPALIPAPIRNNFRPTIRYRTTNRHPTGNSQNSDQSPVPIEITDNHRNRRKRRRNTSPLPVEENIRVKEARQRVYANNLYAKEHSEADSRTRKATPDFYKRYEGAKHRLFPWMKNELELLLYNNTEHVFFVLEVMWKLLDKYHIKSNEFKEGIRPFLFDKTDHFCHELYMFAVSPFDWKTYLKKVQYSEQVSASRWDLSPVRYIGETSGSSTGDTISNSRWEDETPRPTRTRSESSSIEFIEERELDVNITTDSSDSENNRASTSPKLLKITNTNSTEDDPIVVEEADDRSSPSCPVTPVYIDLEDIPPTPTPPRSPVSRENSASPPRPSSPIRYNSPVDHHSRSSPIRHLNSPSFPCSPIRNNSPNLSRSPSPLKGKGKERKKKKFAVSPKTSLANKPSPVRVLMDDSEPCSSKYLT